MKTVKETVSEIIRSDKISLESDSVEKLIYMAYYIGLEKGCKQATDEYKAVLQGQLERVKACRYHKMAMAIQGNVSSVYDSNYAGTMTSTFGGDKTEVFRMNQKITKMTEAELLDKYGVEYSDDWATLDDRFSENGKSIFYCAGCVEDIYRAIKDEQETVDSLPPFTYIEVCGWIMAIY